MNDVEIELSPTQHRLISSKPPHSGYHRYHRRKQIPVGNQYLLHAPLIPVHRPTQEVL